MVATEHTYDWDKLTENQKDVTVLVHRLAFNDQGKKVSQSELRRLFDLGRPKIVIGFKDSSRYTRIADESIDVMKVITREYL